MIQEIFPVTLQLSQIPEYNLQPLLKVFSTKETNFFNHQLSVGSFVDYCKLIYLPTLNFLEKQNISVNLIISGSFLEMARDYYPKIIFAIRKLYSKNQLNLVIDHKYSASVSCLYNIRWWANGVYQTENIVKNILDIPVGMVFLPQLFRGLQLEKYFEKSNINKFFIRSKSGECKITKIPLVSLRKFHGEPVSWISLENNIELEIFSCPDKLFFHCNEAIFSSNIQEFVIAKNMQIGHHYHNYLLRKQQIQRVVGLDFRLNEKYSLALYNHQERAVIRMWEQLSFLVCSKGVKEKMQHIPNFTNEIHALQNIEFFRFLHKENYNPEPNKNFTSMNEAFVNMQNSLKKIEFLLGNKI
jgi:hypothetical protein